MKSIVLLLTLSLPKAVYCQKHVETKVERFPKGMPRAEYSFYRADDGKEVWHGKRTLSGFRMDRNLLRQHMFMGGPKGQLLTGMETDRNGSKVITAMISRWAFG